jgi:hypothetical protein
MPSIVYVTYPFWPPDFGGELLITMERFIDLVKMGNEVTILTAGVKGLPGEEMRDGLHILRSPWTGESRASRLLRRLVFTGWVLRQIIRLRYDILHFAQAGGLGPLSEAFSALCHAMERLGTDASLRRRMGIAARQRIVENFSWRQHLVRWQALYQNNSTELSGRG